MQISQLLTSVFLSKLSASIIISFNFSDIIQYKMYFVDPFNTIHTPVCKVNGTMALFLEDVIYSYCLLFIMINGRNAYSSEKRCNLYLFYGEKSFCVFFFLSLFCNKLPGIHLPTIVPQLLKNIHLCEYFIKKKGCETVLFNRIDTKPSVEMTIEICVVCSNHSGQC